MHHVENKTLPTPLMNFFDNVKIDLNLNTRSKTQEKLKVPLFNFVKNSKDCEVSGCNFVEFTITKFKKIIFSKIFFGI